MAPIAFTSVNYQNRQMGGRIWRGVRQTVRLATERPQELFTVVKEVAKKPKKAATSTVRMNTSRKAIGNQSSTALATTGGKKGSKPYQARKKAYGKSTKAKPEKKQKLKPGTKKILKKLGLMVAGSATGAAFEVGFDHLVRNLLYENGYRKGDMGGMTEEQLKDVVKKTTLELIKKRTGTQSGQTGSTPSTTAAGVKKALTKAVQSKQLKTVAKSGLSKLYQYLQKRREERAQSKPQGHRDLIKRAFGTGIKKKKKGKKGKKKKKKGGNIFTI